MGSSERNYSLDKAKIKFLLLEGIHPRAREIIENAGYTNIVENSGHDQDTHTSLIFTLPPGSAILII